jgi:dolichol kinase
VDITIDGERYPSVARMAAHIVGAVAAIAVVVIGGFARDMQTVTLGLIFLLLVRVDILEWKISRQAADKEG